MRNVNIILSAICAMVGIVALVAGVVTMTVHNMVVGVFACVLAVALYYAEREEQITYKGGSL